MPLFLHFFFIFQHITRQRLITIIAIILFAKDLDSSHQCIPVICTILERSYKALLLSPAAKTSPKEEEAKSLESSFLFAPASTEILPYECEYLPCHNPTLPWNSLEFLSQFTQIMLDKYTNLHPENSWSLSFIGFTDRRGDFEDRRATYLKFHTAILQALQQFNGFFKPEEKQANAQTHLDEANAKLQVLVDLIKNSRVSDISISFLTLYDDEVRRISRPDLFFPLFNWEALKALNKSSQQALKTVQSWDETSYGHLTNSALLAGAISYFNSLFLSTAVFENQHSDKTIKPNRALACIIHMILKNQEIYLSSTDLPLVSFLIAYNRQLEITITSLQQTRYDKKFNIQALQRTFRTLQFTFCN